MCIFFMIYQFYGLGRQIKLCFMYISEVIEFSDGMISSDTNLHFPWYLSSAKMCYRATIPADHKSFNVRFVAQLNWSYIAHRASLNRRIHYLWFGSVCSIIGCVLSHCV